MQQDDEGIDDVINFLNNNDIPNKNINHNNNSNKLKHH